MSDFNGEMFRLAREFRGYAQRDLAALLKIEPSVLSRIENGLVRPQQGLIDNVSRTLKLPEDFFRQSETIYGLPISVHPMWRKKALIPQRDIERAIAEFNVRLLHLRRFLRSIEYEPVLPLPQYDVESYAGDVEKIAMMVRQSWHMPSGPVKDLTAWVERAGCFVIHLNLPDASMSGVTMRVPDVPPCIFLNNTMPADRMRFTLAHELAHLIMHRYPTEEMEDEANMFAGAFLMPASDAHQVFRGKRVDLRMLARLKPEWRMAMQSILKRGKDLGYINNNQARYLWSQFNSNKIRMREPPELDFEIEKPTLLPKLLAMHLTDLKYSLADFTAITKLYEAETLEMYELTGDIRRSTLRAV